MGKIGKRGKEAPFSPLLLIVSIGREAGQGDNEPLGEFMLNYSKTNAIFFCFVFVLRETLCSLF